MEELRLPKRVVKMMFGSKAPGEKYTNAKGKKRVSWQGWFDRWLSRLCTKGKALHHSTAAWIKHLMANSWQDYHLPKVTVEDVAAAMHDPNLRLYVVGNSDERCHFLWAIMDFDDKEKTGRVDELVKRFADAYPVTFANAHVVPSPGGYGRNLLIKLNTSGYTHRQANIMLGNLTEMIKAVVNRPEDPDGLDFDAIKGTYAWTEYDAAGNLIDCCQGVYASFPIPKSQDEYDRLMTMPVMTIDSVASEIMNSTNIHLPLTTCVQIAGPKQSTQAKQDGLSNVMTATYRRDGHSNGRTASYEAIRAEGTPRKRKCLLVCKVAQDQGYPPSDNDESAMALARLYVKEGLNDTTADWPALKKQFKSAIKLITKTWDYGLAGGKGPMSKDYSWVDGIDLSPHVGKLLANGSSMDGIVGTLKVFLYLVENRDMTQEARYRFTVGREHVRKYLMAAKARGQKLKAGTHRGVIGEIMRMAVKLGLVVVIQPGTAGKWSTRYMLGPAHPRFEEWCQKYSEQLQDYDTAIRVMPKATWEGADQMNDEDWASVDPETIEELVF